MTDHARGSAVPDMAIGSDVWPGLAKLAEECGELVQVVGKLIAYPHDPHPDGSDLRARLQEELADVSAAIEYVVHSNDAIDEHAWFSRSHDKLGRFMRWDALERSGR